MVTVVVAFVVGVLVVLWLAGRQSRYQPLFTARREPRFRLNWLWWGLAGAVVVGGSLAFYGLAGLLAPPSADQSRAEATIAMQGPSRLLIPALAVDEKIVAVPLTDKGWDISRLGRHVGWLENTGVRPRDTGAMALVGHVTVSALQTGPFANLHSLKPLDVIIYRSGGYDYVYAVNAVAEVSPAEVQRLFAPGGDHLLLVTCTDWDYLTETYNGRLIVDAVLTKQVPAP